MAVLGLNPRSYPIKGLSFMSFQKRSLDTRRTLSENTPSYSIFSRNHWSQMLFCPSMFESENQTWFVYRRWHQSLKIKKKVFLIIQLIDYRGEFLEFYEFTLTIISQFFSKIAILGMAIFRNTTKIREFTLVIIFAIFSQKWQFN